MDAGGIRRDRAAARLIALRSPLDQAVAAIAPRASV